MPKHKRIACLIFVLITGCTRQPTPLASITPSLPAASTPTQQPSQTPHLPEATPIPPTRAPAQNPRLCSPIAGAPFAQLAQMVSNPYHPPAAGSDDPHKGIDLAVRSPESQVALAGQPVQSVLAGRVAGLVFDRFPFGNAIIIETPLDDFPAQWWSPVRIPTSAPEPSTTLTCPPGAPAAFADPSRRSLYVLYAHLQQPPAFQVGDTVSCGQAIGAVGSTGNALNPHLHFETRVGPSGFAFSSMAHYDNSATADEMRSYCLWSVSEQFQLVDPNQVLQLMP